MKLRSDELLFDGTDGLAKAIVLQACSDYVMVRKGRKIESGGKKINASMDELLDFFHGRWYELLTDIPARAMLRQLDKIV